MIAKTTNQMFIKFELQANRDASSGCMLSLQYSILNDNRT